MPAPLRLSNFIPQFAPAPAAKAAPAAGPKPASAAPAAAPAAAQRPAPAPTAAPRPGAAPAVAAIKPLDKILIYAAAVASLVAVAGAVWVLLTLKGLVENFSS